MNFERRDILQGSGAFALSLFATRSAVAQPAFSPAPGDWRTFETVIRIQIAKPEGRVQAWLPLPAVDQDDWMRSGESVWKADEAVAEVVTGRRSRDRRHQWRQIAACRMVKRARHRNSRGDEPLLKTRPRCLACRPRYRQTATGRGTATLYARF